ncbi:acyl-CoA carboxylase epsilon subunit [Streptomyces sp. NPDC046866]|uniref:acyl-CoA carboxylase epsilon subunit n=1 Tax=Streptomyces sp. NPDC046866 TaxID=3154921 RepID=UPI00345273E7
MTHPELPLASLRVVRGAPTMEELAALAVLLTARLQAPEPEPEVLAAPVPLWPRALPGYQPPGSWAS